MDGQIYNAVESNQPEVLRSLLESGGNANEFYEDMTLISAKSIMHMCCEKGRLECVKVLLEKGANLAIEDTWYQTPLMYCMLTQYHEIADILLSHDPLIVDIGDRYGKTALHIAVEGAALECIEVLMRYDVDVNATTDSGVTPLMMVCGNKYIDPDVAVAIVQTLLAHGADCDIKCYRDRRTALQCTMLTRNVGVVELLLGAGADPSTLDKGGKCPITNLLWYHCKVNSNRELEDDIMTIIIMLIQMGANLVDSRFEHSNALSMATRCGCTPLVAYLLENGGDQNAKFYCGITPLQTACKKRDLITTKLLLQYKSDLYRVGRVKIGAQDYNADVFHIAIDTGAFDIATLLVTCGYDVRKVSYLRDWSILPPNSLQENPMMLKLFRRLAVLVPRLFQLAVRAIRSSFYVNNYQQATEMLPLPRMLAEAIHLNRELTS